MAAEPIMRLAGEGGRKIPRRINLTKRVIDALAAPADGKRYWIYDADTKGLAMMVTPVRKAWYFYKKHKGEPVKVKLGEYPVITPEVARGLAAEKLGEDAKGVDPRPARRSIAASTTLGELHRRWLENYAKPRYKPRTITVEENLYGHTLKDWDGRKLRDITEGMVRDRHAAVNRERGPRTANRCVQLLRRMFNFGRITPNPAGGRAVDFFPERSRDRFLQPGEIPRFFKALEAETNETLRDFFYAALYTGQRRTNVATMRWDELDLDRAVWTIPAAKTKNGEPQHVHLTAPVVALLRVRQQQGEERVGKGDARYAAGYVFPSYRRDAKHPHLTEPKAAWARLLKRAKLSDLRIHDLRRSLGSWAAMTGASMAVIGKALGHLDPASTAIYARLNLDPVRAGVDTALAAILEAAKAEEKPTAAKAAKGKGKRAAGGKKRRGSK